MSSSSNQDSDLILKEDLNAQMEFEKHCIECLRAIVKLSRAPKFKIPTQTAWHLSRNLQELIGEPGNGELLVDLAFSWRIYNYTLPYYLTNEGFEDPKFWICYLDPLPIDVVFPEDLRVALNKLYNRPGKVNSTNDHQNVRRTYRLLSPLFKQDFMQRIVWGDCDSSRFNYEELQRMGWNHNSNPCWLLSIFWDSGSKSEFQVNEEKLKQMFPGYYADEICKTARRDCGSHSPFLSWDDRRQLIDSFSARFGLWPLIAAPGRCASIFYHRELELRRATYFIINLRVPGHLALRLAEITHLEQSI